METTSNHAAQLGCEALEARDNPSGNVAVSVSNGVIFMFGDGFDNNVVLVQNSAGDVFAIGINGTAVNGQSAVFLGNGVPAGVYSDLGDGNDRIEVNGLVTSGSVVLHGGNGNDQNVVVNSSIGWWLEMYGENGSDMNYLANVSASYAVADGGNDVDVIHIDNVFVPSGMFILNTEGQF